MLESACLAGHTGCDTARAFEDPGASGRFFLDFISSDIEAQGKPNEVKQLACLLLDIAYTDYVIEQGEMGGDNRGVAASFGHGIAWAPTSYQRGHLI
jgi:hypothetical protein